MPVINGRACRARFTSLKIGELSSVDNPAQPGALATIMKRHEPAQPDAQVIADLAKYICEDDGAHSFSEVLADNKFSQEIWPYTDALSQSIRSIVGDTSLTGGERETKISASVGEFLAAVRTISPEVEKRLSGLIRKETTMPKSIEELTAKVEELTGQLTAANALVATEKSRADTAETALATTKTELDAAKVAGGELATVKAELATTKAQLVAATDETIKVGGEEIKKSEVGDANFKLAKTLADERQIATLEKRAGELYPHVAGTTAEKALILKAIDGKPEDDPTRKAIEAVLTSCEKMVKAGFDRLGTSGGQTETAKAAQVAFDDKVDEIMKANPNMKKHEAMEKVRQDHPAIFKAYQNGGADDAAAN